MTPDNAKTMGLNSAWKLIHTAPRDGGPFLVCFPRMGNLIVRSRYNKVHEYFISDRETDGGIVKPEFFHDSDLWHPYPPLITPSPVNAELLAAAKAVSEFQSIGNLARLNAAIARAEREGK